MQDLERALADITAIRSQMARDTQFQGYGPATVATTAVLALMAAGAQAALVPAPATEIGAYLTLWIATAIVSVLVIGLEMVARSRRIHSGMADEMIHTATEAFIPAGVAGALLTFVLYRFAPENLWMLPGLWQIVFSLGFFAACRSLPRAMFALPVWYLATGLSCIALATGPLAFSPWLMAVPFGIGQAVMALILHRSTGGGDAEV